MKIIGKIISAVIIFVAADFAVITAINLFSGNNDLSVGSIDKSDYALSFTIANLGNKGGEVVVWLRYEGQGVSTCETIFSIAAKERKYIGALCGYKAKEGEKFQLLSDGLKISQRLLL